MQYEIIGNTSSAPAAPAAPAAAEPAARTTARAARDPEIRICTPQSLKVPLVSSGPCDAETRAAYGVLGLASVVISMPEYGETRYTALRNHTVAACNAIVRMHHPDEPELAWDRHTQEPLCAVNVPVCQPRVSALTEEAYRALGIATVVVDYNGAEYTVLSGAMEAAGAYLAVATRPAPPQWSLPAPGLRLQDWYAGAPTPMVRVLAKLYGVSFLRVLGADNVAYWLPVGSGYHPTVETRARQLGACV